VNFKIEITVRFSESELLQIFPFKRNTAFRKSFMWFWKFPSRLYPKLQNVAGLGDA